MDAKRHRPASRILLQGSELAAREAHAEELGDLARGELEVARGERRSGPGEDGTADIERRREAAARDRQVQVGRTAPDQEIEQRHRSRVGQALQVVEREHERLVSGLEHAKQPCDPARARALRPGLVEVHVRPGEPRIAKGEGEVRIEDVGPVVHVDREPGGDDAARDEAAAAFGEERRLAEPAGGDNHRQAAAGREDPLHEPGAVHVSGRALGNGHPLSEQPGEPGVPVELAAHRLRVRPGVPTDSGHPSRPSPGSVRLRRRSAAPTSRRWRAGALAALVFRVAACAAVAMGPQCPSNRLVGATLVLEKHV